MSLRVLLVDDEEELVSSMSERLAFRGINARYALSGLDALRLTDEQEFDVVVLDLKMAGLSGVDLMRRLDEKREGMKFIFLTGHGSEADYRECCSAGACSYLVKPVEIEILVEKIKEAAA
jgi:DNA-binding response OmpR family regulator